MRYKDWKKLDLNSLINEISKQNLNFNFQESDIELMCEHYLNQLSHLQDKYIIEKSLRLRNKTEVKWLTIEIKSLMNRRDFVQQNLTNLEPEEYQIKNYFKNITIYEILSLDLLEKKNLIIIDLFWKTLTMSGMYCSKVTLIKRSKKKVKKRK